MKELDYVELIKDRAEYAKEDVYKGDCGVISLGERNGYVLVLFSGKIEGNPAADIDVGIRIGDLKVIREYTNSF